MTDSIHIACAADARYVRHAATMLASVMAHTKSRLVIHLLLAANVSDADRHRLEQWISGRGHQVKFCPMDSAAAANLKHSDRFPPVIWFRILMPELLPDVDRVIYLDSDVLAADDIAILWNTPLGDCLVGAVTNPMDPEFHYPHFVGKLRKFGLPDESRYFNSGVLLMDLAAMRSGKVVEQFLEFASAHRDDLQYPDQDTLNGVLYGRRLPLAPRWNAQTAMLDKNLGQGLFSAAEWDEVNNRPALIHFEGNWWFKPWDARCKHPQRWRYRVYRKQTPWPTYIPDGLVRAWLMPLFPHALQSALRRLKAALG